MPDAIVFEHPEYAIGIRGASDIHGLWGEFIDSGEVACHPVSVGKIEPIASCLQKRLTRFSPKTEDHIVPLRITPAPSQRHAA